MDTVDIFESVDNSLSLFEKAQERDHLKPVKDLRNIVIGSFKDGRCECSRCKDNEYDDSEYTPPHTYQIEGVIKHRLFSVGMHSNLFSAIKKVWKDAFDLELDVKQASLIDKATLNYLAKHQPEFEILVEATGLGSSDNEKYIISPPLD